RLLGVTASGLGERDQLSLFGVDDPRRRKVVEAADAVRHRYGERAITRARLVGSRLPAPFERDPMTPVDPRSGGTPDDVDPPQPNDPEDGVDVDFRDSEGVTTGAEGVFDDT